MKLRHVRLFAAACLSCAVGAAHALPIVYSAGGSNDPASIQAVVDQFRAALGEPNNGNAPGSQASGRREINWDGGGAAAPATAFPVPMTTFQGRGAVFTTPGTGFEISGQPTPEFGDIDATYPGQFNSFSSPRLFTALGSNITDILFFVPGSNTRALTSGFGSVFTDVDLTGSTFMEFFGPNDASLGIFTVEPGTTPSESLSFLGVSFSEGPVISRVRITSGNAALGGAEGAGIDLVVMDDFIYAEPQAVDEPKAPWLLAAVLAAAMLLGQQRARRIAIVRAPCPRATTS